MKFLSEKIITNLPISLPFAYHCLSGNEFSTGASLRQLGDHHVQWLHRIPSVFCITFSQYSLIVFYINTIWKGYCKRKYKGKIVCLCNMLTVASAHCLWSVTSTQGHMSMTEHLFALVLTRIKQWQNLVGWAIHGAIHVWLIKPIWAWFFPWIKLPLEQTVLQKSLLRNGK